MSALRGVAGGVAESLAPDGTLIRVRFRMSLDMLLTLAVAVLAIGLAVGYQVLGRWGHRFFGSE